LGFLPKKQSARRELFQSLKNEKRTLVSYESPHRLADTLGLIAAVMGDTRQVCIAREMTKKFEEFWRGTALEAAKHYGSENPKGEVTLLIAPAVAENGSWDKAKVLAELENRLEAGQALNQAAKEIAALSGWKKSAVYDLGLED
jgi:16S rRNA (cytidine1402-2'-O)-methyltransferase